MWPFKSKKNSSVVRVEPLPEAITSNDISNFEAALIYTFANEGTLSNNKFDKGGITKYGIIIEDLKRIGKKNPTSDDIRNLTMDEAKAIYKKLYWDELNLDEIKSRIVSICMFDIGVVRGTGIPPKYCVEIVGSKDIQSINLFDPKEFVKQFSARSLSGFQQIVARNPSQREFINGWTNRANRLLSLI